ncbi:MAG: potassium transporter [Chloroflexaceae bacterium]|nr:potassium transporter [Chloroflexaceae bacterium]
MRKITLKNRLQYAFDNAISQGAFGLIGWLGATAMVLVGAIATLTWFLADRTAGGLVEFLWSSLVSTLVGWDPTEGNPWLLRLSSLLIIAINLFGVSILIGFIVTGLEEKLNELRRGRSVVIERGHTVILGWSSQVFPLIRELAIANENLSDAAIAILGNEDKVAMEDTLRSQIGPLKKTRIIVRSGIPSDMSDLALVSLDTARSIVVLPPEDDNPDVSAIKTLLAIVNNPDRRPEPYHIVTTVYDRKNLTIANVIGQGEITCFCSTEAIARIAAQICRQPGLSQVYAELFSFAGDEFYFHEEPRLQGKTFADALLAYEDCAVVGLYAQGGQPQLNPPMHTQINAADQIIAIAADHHTLALAAPNQVAIDAKAIQVSAPAPIQPEKFLILGWNYLGSMLLEELNHYVALGSSVTVVADFKQAEAEIIQTRQHLSHLNVNYRSGDITDRQLLDSLDFGALSTVIVLSYSDRLDSEQADAIALTTLLHLRHIAKQQGHHFSITSEILDARNQRLARTAQISDFILSERLISYLLAQISENKLIAPVFEEILDPKGSDIHLKPASNYVALGEPITFYTVIAAAQQRGEVAFGYFQSSRSYRADRGFGVAINPPKSQPITFVEGDRLILLSED